ncbi:hypothetical protein VitviT2T_007056 [Vitis vinifera]|uniref:Uncharacterized protein n=1 Tax=Vitis vinifera TaxID=29760 RepID=A0ABY9BYH0_VITVI|nr:hypothetical protein VitviT2T_007056 [Vitis vinifera]
MLEDDVRVAFQQVLVTNHPANNDKTRSSKLSNQLRQEGSVRPVDNTITFPLIDVNQVLQPHEDALILTLGVGDFDMRIILDDLSSSTDFLQMSTYKQMNYLPSTLENLGRLLFRFNGATITSLGDVVLIVQANPTILSMRFSMVDNLSPYNAIMGHA